MELKKKYPLLLQEIIGNFEQFLFDYPVYDIASNKPFYETTFNFDVNHIYMLLAQLLLRVGDDCRAEYYLMENNICPDIYTTENECYDIGDDSQSSADDQCLCNDIDELLILDCIETILNE